MIIFFAGPAHAKKKYSLVIQSNGDEFQLGESATFNVEIVTKKRHLRNVTLQSTFPDNSTEVFLTQESRMAYSYDTGSLNEEGKQTFSVKLYKKNQLKHIRFLKHLKQCLENKIQVLEDWKRRCPWKRKWLQRSINHLQHLIQSIDKNLEKLSIPIAEESKIIIVLPGNIDTEPPVIEPIADFFAEATAQLTEVTIPLPNVTDNSDSNPTITHDAPASFPLGSTIVTFTATDSSNNSSTLSISVIIEDTTAPLIQIVDPLDGTSTQNDSIIISGTVSDIFLNSVQINGLTPTISDNEWFISIGLDLGPTNITAVATDSSLNQSSHTITIERTTPVSLPEIQINTPANGSTLNSSLVLFDITWQPTDHPLDLDTASITINSIDYTDSFKITDTGAFYESTQNNPIEDGNYTLVASIKDIHGNEASANSIFTVDGADLLPPPVITDESSYLTGRVMHSRNDTPLHGVKVTINGNATDAVYTNSEGYYTYPVSEISEHVLLIEHPNFSYSLKRVDITDPSLDYTVETALLTPIDPAVTTITETGGTYAHSQDLIRIDFPSGALNPGESINVQSIWYESGEEIPGKLPRTSAFTYCIELLPDGTIFYEPVTVRHKNTRGFVPNTEIPVGYFNRNTALWEHAAIAKVDESGTWVEFQTTHFSPFDTNMSSRLRLGGIDGSGSPSYSGSPGNSYRPRRAPLAQAKINFIPNFWDFSNGGQVKSQQYENINYAIGDLNIDHFLVNSGNYINLNNKLTYNSKTVNLREIVEVEVDNSPVKDDVPIQEVSEYLTFQGLYTEKKYYEPTKDTQRIKHLVDLKNHRNGESSPLDTGIYTYNIHHNTTLELEFFLTAQSRFGGIAQQPTGVFGSEIVSGQMMGAIQVINNRESFFGKGWNYADLEKIHFKIAPSLQSILIEKGTGESILMEPLINEYHNNFTIAKDKDASSFYAYIHDSNGVVTKTIAIDPFQSSEYTPVILDFTNDGLDDIIALHIDGNLALFVNNQDKATESGTEPFVESSIELTGEDVSENNEFLSPFASDYDNDGKQDLLFTSGFANSGIFLLKNENPTGGNSSPYEGSLTSVSKIKSFIVAKGDFNADKKTDYIASDVHPSSESDINYFQLIQENGELLKTFKTATGTNYIRDIYVTDLNEDKRDDLIVNMKRVASDDGYGGGDAFNHHIVRLYLADINGFLPTVGTPIYEDFNATGNCAVGDFNRDGNTDVATITFDPSFYETTIRLFEGNGYGALDENPDKEQIIFVYQEEESQAIKVVDSNLDRNPDILWINQNDFGVLFGLGNGTFSNPFTNSLGLWGDHQFDISSFTNLNQSIQKYKGPPQDDSLLTIDFTNPLPFRRLLTSGEVIMYNSDGLITKHVDKGGNESLFSYIDVNDDDLDHEIKSITFPNGKQLQFEYNSNGQVDKIIDSQNRETIMVYDSTNNMTEIRNPDQTAKKFIYDSVGLLTEYVDENNNSYKYEYSDEGFLIRKISPTRKEAIVNSAGGISESHPKSKVINIQPAVLTGLPEGNSGLTPEDPIPNIGDDFLQFTVSVADYSETVVGVVNHLDSITQITDELSHTTIFDRDDRNNITKITKPNFSDYSMAYDEFGNLLSKKDNSLGASYLYEYEDKYQQETKITNTKNKSYNINYLGENTGNHLPLITQITDPLNNSLIYDYSNFGSLKNLLSKKTDRRGNSINYEYDGDGNVSRIYTQITRVDENGTDIPETVQILMTYDGAGNLTHLTDPRGNEYSYNYDVMNRLKKTTYPDSTFSTNEYDNVGNLTKNTDREGNETQFIYDAVNRLTQVIDAHNEDTFYHYDGKDRLAYTEDAEGNITKFFYDERGQVKKTWNAEGNLTEFEYDENSNIQKITKPMGADFDFTYDPSDRLIKLEYPNQTGGRPVVEIEYDDEGNRTKVTRNGRATNFDYDDLNRLTNVEFPDNTTIENQYDANSNLETETTRNKTYYNYSYDELNRLVNVIDPLSIRTAHYQYDLASNIIANTNALGRTTRYFYNPNDRLERIQDALLQSTHFTYSPEGDLERVIDRNGIATVNEYDDLHRIIKAIENADSANPDNKRTTEFGYDKIGNRTSILDGNGNTTLFNYDALSRVKTHTLPDDSLYSIDYDSLGRLVRKVTPMGEITYDYDLGGNLLTKTLPSETYTYGYDIFDNLTSASNGIAYCDYTYDTVDRIDTATKTINGNAFNLDYDYILARLDHFTSPAGTISYTYDDNDRITQIATSDGDQFTYSYSDLGEVLGKTRPNNINESNSFDELSRLISIANTLNTNNVLSLVYDYDPEGNKLHELTSFDDTLGTTKESGKLYKYDDLYRLRATKVFNPADYAGTPTFDTAPTFSELTNLDLDILGNRKTVQVENGVGVIEALQNYNGGSSAYNADEVNKINQVETIGEGTTSFAYDLNGNLTDDGKNLYTYNVENKLLEVRDKATDGVTAIYDYDAEGRPVRKTVGASETLYLHSGSQVIEEFDGAGNPLKWRVHGLGIDELLRVSGTAVGGQKLYPLTNDQQSVYATTDSSGNVLQRYDYDAFGEVTVQDADGNDVLDAPIDTTLFQGRELDLESGLYYFRARYYSPELGRFISHDPMDYVDGMNMYQFVRGNPVRFTDPMGLMLAEVSILQPNDLGITREYTVINPPEIDIPKGKPIENVPPEIEGIPNGINDTPIRTETPIEDIQPEIEGIENNINKPEEQEGKPIEQPESVMLFNKPDSGGDGATSGEIIKETEGEAKGPTEKPKEGGSAEKILDELKIVGETGKGNKIAEGGSETAADIFNKETEGSDKTIRDNTTGGGSQASGKTTSGENITVRFKPDKSARLHVGKEKIIFPK